MSTIPAAKTVYGGSRAGGRNGTFRTMGFIQIIEYETDRFDEIKALGDESMEGSEMPPGFRMR